MTKDDGFSHESLPEPYVRRCLWLATWPAELRTAAQARLEVFTTRVLLGVLATSMARFETNGWRVLRAEIERIGAKGTGARRRKRRGAASPAGAARSLQVGSSEALDATLRQQMIAEALVREALMTQVKVDGEWIRIRYFGAEDLAHIARMLRVAAQQN